MEPDSIAARREQVAACDLRAVHPLLAFGTASDRYAAWIGQVYPERWATKAETRKKKLGRETIEEVQLPILSVRDYFAHFPVLELDFTFYRPLREEDDRPGSNFFVLQEYAECAPPEARFLLKAPQAYTARTLRRSTRSGPRYEENPSYLDADGYNRHFVEPALELLGPRLAGVIFEQEYTRVRESPEPEAFVAGLDRFFREAVRTPQVHLEVRSAHLLVPAYFDWLEEHGLGFVFSHWTWLPSIKEQWERIGGRLPAADGQVVLRLMNPRGMSHTEAMLKAYPFDRPVPELSETPQALQMVDEATALAYRAIGQGRTLHVIASNRAWGNAPALLQAVAARFLDFAAERGV